MDSQVGPGRMPLDGVSGFDQSPTPEQHGTLRALRVADASVRHAPLGPDVFAYVEDEHATLRLQIAPDGGVVGQTVLTR
jgi:hypothetical protein